VVEYRKWNIVKTTDSQGLRKIMEVPEKKTIGGEKVIGVPKFPYILVIANMHAVTLFYKTCQYKGAGRNIFRRIFFFWR